jgi:hypothetical protein
LVAMLAAGADVYAGTGHVAPGAPLTRRKWLPFIPPLTGRNILIGPGLATVDLSLSRRFKLAERASGLLGVQAFNLLNRENLNLPDLYADSPASFGKIFSAKSPRQVQMLLRFNL